MARDAGPTPDKAEPLLTRLLRRRADEPAAHEAAPRQSATPTGATAPVSSPAPDPAGDDTGTPRAGDGAPPPSRVDPHSGRPVDELADADLPPIESIGPDSDVRAFLGRNISPELRRQALRKLFHQPKFNVVCLCAEYAENYNNFTPMGAIVPHDLKRQLALQAERLARRALEDQAGTAAAGASAHESPGPGAETMLQRDDDEASTKVLRDLDTAPPEASHPAAGKPRRG